MVLNKLKTILEMIKFEHTIFALPFAYVGMILGSMEKFGYLPTWGQFFWITMAMVGARSASMALNRLIDRTIDALNPRTADRAIPAGKLGIKEVLIFVIASFALFIFATLQLSELAFKLLPLAIFVLVIYSYTKRFTWMCHYILGAAIGLAPLGAWVAVTNEITYPAIVLFITVALWTAGFDIIYATQDMEFDKEKGLYSIPSRFGLKKSLLIARISHALTIVGLVYLFFLMDLGWLYLIGVIIANFILHYEHSIISAEDMSRLDTAFFTMNGVLSVIVFIFTFIDLVI
ncbi:4-hydroxybenzoate octaprenyltransferase [Vulcanibacillus modesticaldus]|uniref:4-hydroxybenzoate polyprenyltransferase n=1 Tax=Vulcanibacillus modesticaldus TaxID=337097 RepID=A0A1D2YSL4_9BACI|nr:UbiA-like polyprenyltransferase [Vulcanibacillus modesticaldus]OEF97296.1 4-hydroxybenzoate octaprenyltransferase [Vulcanibacillus modesticaldus]